MDIFTVMFIGRSGCGKGTQADLLMKEIKSRDQERDIFYLESGQKFREFIGHNTYSSNLAKVVMDKGELQPSFLAIWNWSHLLVENLTDNEHLIFDGTPRKLDEAMILDTALKFYGRVKPMVVHLKVSREWSRTRLVARGRVDDQVSSLIDRRLDWFDHDVLPTIDFYRSHPDYQLLEINGEQPIVAVQADILKAIFNHD